MASKNLCKVVEYKLDDDGNWNAVKVIKSNLSEGRAHVLRDKLSEKNDMTPGDMLAYVVKPVGSSLIIT